MSLGSKSGAFVSFVRWYMACGTRPAGPLRAPERPPLSPFAPIFGAPPALAHGSANQLSLEARCPH